MPNCFQLTRIGEEKPMSLAKVDEEMCKHFKVDSHPRIYYCYWFDCIGWKIAVNGMKLADVVKEYQQECANACLMTEDYRYWSKLLAIAQWLEANFTTTAWVQIGK